MSDENEVKEALKDIEEKNGHSLDITVKKIGIEASNLKKIKLFKGFFEDKAKSSKESDLLDYITNHAIKAYFESEDFKNEFEEALKS